MTQAYAPRSLKEAVSYLAEAPELTPIAGCTDLMVAGTQQLQDRKDVLDLLRIPEIRGIRQDQNGWRIGATTTFREIATSRKIQRAFPALAAAASEIGGWQIQNRATLGGNIANASPAGDSLPVLLALDATIVTAGPSGQREIPYHEFHLGYRKTALQSKEIIAWIRIPDASSGTIQFFRKVGTREAQAISKVVVAMSACKQDGRLEEVRFGAGSVAPVPVRLEAAETACKGRPPNAEVADKTAEAAMAEVTPIDDVRSTAAYRRFVLGRVVRRMILDSAEK
jgi:CO/xanthine dehydrogenase FAD-binding subunit